jgi:putative heme iron utilization protein
LELLATFDQVLAEVSTWGSCNTLVTAAAAAGGGAVV